jgi:hypothetical protein
MDEREITLQVNAADGMVAEYVRGGTICPTCFEIHGRLCLRGFRSGVYDQLCPCDPEPTHPHVGTWRGFDFSTLIELCYCCGRRPIRSGSRWSPFFCEDCKPRIRELNERVGFALVPIGRHSIMNGVFFTAETPPALIVGATRFLFARIDDLRTWRREVVRENLERLGLPHSEPALADDLERARSLHGCKAFELRDRFLELNGLEAIRAPRWKDDS